MKPLKYHMLGTDWLGTSSAGRALWVLVGISWMNQPCAMAARNTSSILACINVSTARGSDYPSLALIWLHLEHCIPHQHQQDPDNQTEFSRGPPRWSGLRALALWVEAIGAGLSNLEKGQLQGDPTAAPTYLQWGCQEGGAKLFTVVCGRKKRKERQLETRDADVDIQRKLFLHNNSQEVEQVAQTGPDPALCRKVDYRPPEVLFHLNYPTINSDSLFHSHTASLHASYICLCTQITHMKPPRHTGLAFQNISD